VVKRVDGANILVTQWKTKLLADWIDELVFDRARVSVTIGAIGGHDTYSQF